MNRCCYADEYGEQFTDGRARRTASRFRRRGLRGAARTLADQVVAAGVDGASVLEVGGGVGHLQAHMLRAGAARAVNVELSPGWEAAAAALLSNLGLRHRVERHVADFVEEADRLPDADVVVLHRVVCCYPDWPAMMAAAVSRARRVVALTLPVDRWWARALIRCENGLQRLRRREFRAFVHPADRVVAMVADAGFAVAFDGAGPLWRTVVLERPAPAA